MEYEEQKNMNTPNKKIAEQAYDDLCDDLDILINKYQERLGPALWVFTVMSKAANVAFCCAPDNEAAVKIIQEAIEAGKDF